MNQEATAESRSENETYLVPGELAFAISTRRPQLIQILKNKVKAGRGVVPKQQVLEILDLVQDSILDRIRHDEEQQVFAERYAKRIRAAINGDVVRLGALRRIADDLHAP